jgi:hypothetical protein
VILKFDGVAAPSAGSYTFSWAALFLAVPMLIFPLGFLRWELAVPLVTLTLTALAKVGLPSIPRPSKRLLVALGFSAVILLLMGFPSGPYAWDWIKHWAILDTLIVNDWHEAISVNGRPAFLRFYVGAYLAPALAAKALGVSALWPTLLWFGAGVALIAGCLTETLIDRKLHRPIVLLALFVLMAGADAVAGNVIRHFLGMPYADMWGIHHEGWAATTTGPPLQYSSPLAMLLWVPHQAIATMLVTFLILLDRSPHSFARCSLAMGALSIWSPYGLIGAIPLFGIRFIEELRFARDATHWRVVFVTSACAALFAGSVALVLSEGLPPGASLCLTCVPARIAEPWRYILFPVVELVGPLLILRGRLFRDPYALGSALILVCLPLAAADLADPVMRISLGPISLLMAKSALVATNALTSRAIGQVTLLDSIATVAAIALVAPTAVSEAGYHIENGVRHRSFTRSDYLGAKLYGTFAPSHRIDITQFFKMCGTEWESQYFVDRRPGLYRE